MIKTYLLPYFILLLFVACDSTDEPAETQNSATTAIDTGIATIVPTEALAEKPDTIDTSNVTHGRFPDDVSLFEYAFNEEDTTHYYDGDMLLHEGVLEGTLFEIQEGDYLHFVIADGDHKLHSFWVATQVPFDLIEEIVYEHPDKYKGSRCTVSWIRERKYIPESGGEMVLYSMTNIEFVE